MKDQDVEKVTWEDRARDVYRRFPFLVDTDWVRALNDIDLLGRVVKDVLRSSKATTGPRRFGPRPNPTEAEMASQLRQFVGEDYTELPFGQALALLMQNQEVSIRGLAEATGVPKSMLHRSLQGDRAPNMDEMRAIATFFRRQPSFFFEYRMLGFIAALIVKFERSPETLTHLYEQLAGTPRG